MLKKKSKLLLLSSSRMNVLSLVKCWSENV